MATIIVAWDDKRGIGLNNSLPWKVSEDLKQFKRLTTGQVVIMGRKTWDSLPKKPLFDRWNIVISRHVEEVTARCPDNVLVVKDLDMAVDIGLIGGKEVYIIGGSQIYKEAIEKQLADKMIVSQIEGDYGCDTFFPEFGPEWHLEKESENPGFRTLEYILER